MPKPARKRYRYRSAITGRYVSASYAKRYPDRTVRESVVRGTLADYHKLVAALKARP